MPHEVFLENIDLTEVDKVCNSQQIFGFQASDVNQRMGVLVSLQDIFEEWTRGCQDDFVGLNLVTILTGQGHISKVIGLSQISICTPDIVLEIVPLQAELFIHIGDIWCVTWVTFEKSSALDICSFSLSNLGRIALSVKPTSATNFDGDYDDDDNNFFYNDYNDRGNGD